MIFQIIRNNQIKDIVLLEQYKGYNIYQIVPMVESYVMNDMKFVFTKNGLNYIRTKDTLIIKNAIDGIKSFLMIGIYEEKHKQEKLKKILIELAQNQNTKTLLSGEKLC